MEVAGSVAEFKKANNKPVYDAERERKLLESVENNAGEKFGDYARKLYNSILELSRTYQNGLINERSTLSDEILNAVETTPKLFPEKAIVACQGLEGAHSSHACQKLLKSHLLCTPNPLRLFFRQLTAGFAHTALFPLKTAAQEA